MSLIWDAVIFSAGAVFGAKHQTITLYFYQRYKPVIDAIKAWLATKFGWFKK